MNYFNYIIFPIYLDYNSTTPVDPRVLEKFIPYFYYKFGNQNSRNHSCGVYSNYSIEFSKKIISEFLNCDTREIIFYSNATESNKLLIEGFCGFYMNKGKKIAILKIEHNSIVDVVKNLSNIGLDVLYLESNCNGLLNLEILKNHIVFNNNIILFILSYVNSEIGVIQNIEFISLFCKIRNIKLHLDCTQAVGKIKINLRNISADMAIISPHKFYAPKGCSILYVRRKSNLYFKTSAVFRYEKNFLKFGTMQTAQIISICESILIIKKNFFFENLKIKNLKNLFFKEVMKINKTKLNGDFKYRVPTNLNLDLSLLEYSKLLNIIKFISFSQSSACSYDYSHVLKFLKKSFKSSIRFSFGRFNKICEIYFLIKLIFLYVYKNIYI